MSFLIYTRAGNVSVPIIDRFTHYVAGEHHDFVIHEHEGNRRLTQYRTGYCLTTEQAPETIEACRAWLDSIEKATSARKMKQILNEQETINPPPTDVKDENTMSLEQELKENTEAVKALTTALIASLQNPVNQGVALAGKDTPKGDIAKEESAADRKSRLKVEKELYDAAQTKTKAAEAPAAPAIDFEKDVKPLVVKISVDHGREKAVALLQRFGVSRTPDLLPAQYPDVIKFANEILNAKRDPEAAQDDI
jgi:hypothetical protein